MIDDTVKSLEDFRKKYLPDTMEELREQMLRDLSPAELGEHWAQEFLENAALLMES